MTEWLRALLSVALVLGLVVGLRFWLGRAAWGQRRGRRPNQPGRLETLDRLALSPQHTLYLVRVGNRAVLIGAHPGGCHLLERLPAEMLKEAASREAG